MGRDGRRRAGPSLLALRQRCLQPVGADARKRRSSWCSSTKAPCVCAFTVAATGRSSRRIVHPETARTLAALHRRCRRCGRSPRLGCEPENQSRPTTASAAPTTRAAIGIDPRGLRQRREGEPVYRLRDARLTKSRVERRAPPTNGVRCVDRRRRLRCHAARAGRADVGLGHEHDARRRAPPAPGVASSFPSASR